ncbi:MAK10-like protein [Tanacetum coccineum]
MGDENPIRTLGDYSKPSHEFYRNTIDLPAGYDVVPLRSDTIQLGQNGFSFYGLRSEDPNQHLKDFLKLVDSLDLDGENKERTRLCLFQFSLCDQASNWLERLPAGSISTWEDLTTRFLAQFFLPGRTTKLYNDILMFQQHHGESFSEAWTRFKDLLQKVPHHGIDLWLQVQVFYDHINPVTRRTIDQSVGGKLRDLNPEESWAILEDLALYENGSWNDPRDFAKPVKAISLPQDVPSTSDRHLFELENHVQRLMEAHIAPTQPTQVNKITTPCEICSGPHNTQNCMENHEQAFVEYASSRTDEAGGLVSEFMASQDARLSKFEADFKRQQGEMTNKIDIVLKAITDQIVDPQSSTHIHSSINAITIHPKQHEESQVNKPDESSLGNISSNPYPQPDPLASIATEQVRKLNSMLESLGLVPQSSNTKLVCTKEEDGEVMFIKIIRDDKSPNEGEGTTTEGPTVEYFDTFLTRDELTYHKKLDPRENANGGISNFTGRIKGMHVFVGNFTYVVDFMIVEDISSIIDPRLSQVVLGRPFIEISNMTHDPPEGVVRFTNGTDEVAYKMPHKIEQYDSLSDLEKEHTKLVYLRNEEDKR